MVDHKDIVSQWVERAEYDLSAAGAMLKSGHLLYVAFFCQQAAEKILKAAWCHIRQDAPPFTHNLATLSESLDLRLSDAQLRLIDRLNRYYIVGRYPTFKQKLASELKVQDATGFLKRTKEFVAWCRTSILTSKK